jgi:N-acetylglutamate synthase-like GNAT family acetyltransferase
LHTTIRRARSEDAASIQHILHQAHRQNIKDGFIFPAFNLKKRQLRFRIKRDTYYLLMNDGIAIGTIAIKKRKHYMEIGSLAILSTYWKRGLGLRLLRYAERKVRRMGWSRVVLFTPNGHPTLPLYYQKQGYRIQRLANDKNRLWIKFEKWLV